MYNIVSDVCSLRALVQASPLRGGFRQGLVLGQGGDRAQRGGKDPVGRKEDVGDHQAHQQSLHDSQVAGGSSPHFGDHVPVGLYGFQGPFEFRFRIPESSVQALGE